MYRGDRNNSLVRRTNSVSVSARSLALCCRATRTMVHVDSHTCGPNSNQHITDSRRLVFEVLYSRKASQETTSPTSICTYVPLRKGTDGPVIGVWLKVLRSPQTFGRPATKSCRFLRRCISVKRKRKKPSKRNPSMNLQIYLNKGYFYDGGLRPLKHDA